MAGSAALVAAEGVVLIALGASPAAAVWTTAPLPTASLHDLAVALAVPADLWHTAVLVGGLVVVRTGILVRLARMGGSTTGFGPVLAGQVAVTGLVSLPAALLVAVGLTGVPYLLFAVMVVMVLLVAVTATLYGFTSTAAALGLTAGLTLLGASAHALPGHWALVPLLAAGALCGRVLLDNAPRLPAGPRLRPLVLRASAALLLTVLLGGGSYLIVAGGPSTSSSGPVAVEPAPGEQAAPVLVVDGFNTPFRARPDLGLRRPTWGFSYRGLTGDGALIPHEPGDTLGGIHLVADELAAQVRRLHAVYGHPVSVVGVSQGALVARHAAARQLLHGHVDRLVLVDLPAGVGYIHQATADDPRGRATGWALGTTAALLESLTPLQVRADAALPLEMQDCTVIGPAAPIGLPEVRLRSLTDAVVHRVPAPASVTVLDHPGAHALTTHLSVGRRAIAQALTQPVRQPVVGAAASLLHHLWAPWRLPAVPTTCTDEARPGLEVSRVAATGPLSSVTGPS